MFSTNLPLEGGFITNDDASDNCISVPHGCLTANTAKLAVRHVPVDVDALQRVACDAAGVQRRNQLQKVRRSITLCILYLTLAQLGTYNQVFGA